MQTSHVFCHLSHVFLVAVFLLRLLRHQAPDPIDYGESSCNRGVEHPCVHSP